MMQPCPVCQTPGALESSFQDINLLRCPSCSHCWTDISKMEEQEEYSTEYFLSTHRNWFENPDYAFFEKFLKLALAQRMDATVLDIGCGTGNLLRFMRE